MAEELNNIGEALEKAAQAAGGGDPEVIQDLWIRASNKGYTGTLSDFEVLIGNDAEVFDDMYGYVKGKGYGGGKYEFAKLVGSNKFEEEYLKRDQQYGWRDLKTKKLKEGLPRDTEEILKDFEAGRRTLSGTLLPTEGDKGSSPGNTLGKEFTVADPNNPEHMKLVEEKIRSTMTPEENLKMQRDAQKWMMQVEKDWKNSSLYKEQVEENKQNIVSELEEKISLETDPLKKKYQEFLLSNARQNKNMQQTKSFDMWLDDITPEEIREIQYSLTDEQIPQQFKDDYKIKVEAYTQRGGDTSKIPSFEDWFKGQDGEYYDWFKKNNQSSRTQIQNQTRDNLLKIGLDDALTEEGKEASKRGEILNKEEYFTSPEAQQAWAQNNAAMTMGITPMTPAEIIEQDYEKKFSEMIEEAREKKASMTTMEALELANKMAFADEGAKMEWISSATQKEPLTMAEKLEVKRRWDKWVEQQDISAEKKVNLQLQEDPTFIKDLEKMSSGLVGLEENRVAAFINKNFGKYGIVANPENNDGRESVWIQSGRHIKEFKIGLGTDFANDIKKFIKGVASPAIEINTNISDQAITAQALRKTPRVGEDGKRESFKWEMYKDGDKYKVVPTLFPTNKDLYDSNPALWTEAKDLEEAKQMASVRAEVFSFNTEKDAQDFMKQWNNITPAEAVAIKHYASRGLDFLAHRKNLNYLDKLQAKIDYYEKMQYLDDPRVREEIELVDPKTGKLLDPSSEEFKRAYISARTPFDTESYISGDKTFYEAKQGGTPDSGDGKIKLKDLGKPVTGIPIPFAKDIGDFLSSVFRSAEVSLYEAISPEDMLFQGPDGTNEELERLYKEKKSFRETAFNEELLRAQEDLDAALQREMNRIVGNEAEFMTTAQEKMNNLNTRTLAEFGVHVNQLPYVQPKTEEEMSTLINLIQQGIDTEAAYNTATTLKNDAQLFFSLKHDKGIKAKIDDGMDWYSNAISNGWKRGEAAEVMYQIMQHNSASQLTGKVFSIDEAGVTGSIDISDVNARKKAADKIAAAYKSQSPTTSRFMNRWSKADGFWEAFEVIADDPVGGSFALFAESMAQMGPYGMKIIPQQVGVGAAVGGWGGGLMGLRSGFATTSFIMEYTATIFDEMQKLKHPDGTPYSITNPDDVFAALSNQEFIDMASDRGKTRGLPISLVDFLSANLAGRVFKPSVLSSKTGQLARIPLEQVISGPIAGSTGELAAQLNEMRKGYRTEVDRGEVFLEGFGEIFGNVSNLAINVAQDMNNISNIELADKLTDINYVNSLPDSDAKISNWANKMFDLKKIDGETNQAIQENIAARKQASEIADVSSKNTLLNRITRSKRSSKEALTKRLSQLIRAKERLSKSEATKDAYKDQIREINDEIKEISRTGKLRLSKDEVTVAQSPTNAITSTKIKDFIVSIANMVKKNPETRLEQSQREEQEFQEKTKPKRRSRRLTQQKRNELSNRRNELQTLKAKGAITPEGQKLLDNINAQLENEAKADRESVEADANIETLPSEKFQVDVGEEIAPTTQQFFIPNNKGIKSRVTREDFLKHIDGLTDEEINEQIDKELIDMTNVNLKDELATRLEESLIAADDIKEGQYVVLDAEGNRKNISRNEMENIVEGLDGNNINNTSIIILDDEALQNKLNEKQKIHNKKLKKGNKGRHRKTIDAVSGVSSSILLAPNVSVNFNEATAEMVKERGAKKKTQETSKIVKDFATQAILESEGTLNKNDVSLVDVEENKKEILVKGKPTEHNIVENVDGTFAVEINDKIVKDKLNSENEAITAYVEEVSGPTKTETDAVQEQSTTKVDADKQTGDGKKVADGTSKTKPKKPTGKKRQDKKDEQKKYVYTIKKENKKDWKKDFEIIDNRPNAEGNREMGDTEANWIVYNTVTGGSVEARTKKDAQQILATADSQPGIWATGEELTEQEARELSALDDNESISPAYVEVVEEVPVTEETTDKVSSDETVEEDIDTIISDMMAAIQKQEDETYYVQRKVKDRPDFKGEESVEFDVDESQMITEVMNKMKSPNIAVKINPTKKRTSINVDDLNNRSEVKYEKLTPEQFEERFSDIPFIFTISDALTAGEVTNPNTGNKITNLRGGLGFHGQKGNENVAWANLKGKAKGLLDEAQEVYQNNKATFDAWWKANPEYNGLVPMGIVKMGEDAITSNEALFRVLNDNLTKIPKANKRKALTYLKNKELPSLIQKFNRLAEEGIKKGAKKATIDANKKQAKQLQNILNWIKDNKMTSIEDVLSTENLNIQDEKGDPVIALADRVVLINKLLIGKPNKHGQSKKIPSNLNKNSTVRVLMGLEQEEGVGKSNPAANKKFKKFAPLLTMSTAVDLITEPAMKDVQQREIIAITGVDVKNPKVLYSSSSQQRKGKSAIRKDADMFDAPVSRKALNSIRASVAKSQPLSDMPQVLSILLKGYGKSNLSSKIEEDITNDIYSFTEEDYILDILLEGMDKESPITYGELANVYQYFVGDNKSITEILDMFQGIGKGTTGVNMLFDKELSEETFIHPNYPEGVRGKSLGVLTESLSMQEVFPAAYNQVLKELVKYEKQQKGVTRETISSDGVPTQSGLSALEFRGAKFESLNISDRNKLINFINTSFPQVRVYTDRDSFARIMEDENVKQYKKGDQVIYGMTLGRDIYINPDVHRSESAIYNTAIHEMGHVWLNTLEGTIKGKKLLKKGKSLVEQTQEYQKYLKEFNGDKDRAAKEALAVLIGNKGETITDAALKTKFEEWLLALWNYVKQTFKLSKDLTAQEVQNLTLDEFVGTALADIMSGKELKLTAAQSQMLNLNNPEVFFKAEDSVSEIVQRARLNNFADRHIREYLKRFTDLTEAEITEALAVPLEEDGSQLGLFTEYLPESFANVEGGVNVGMETYTNIKDKLKDFAHTGKSGRRTKKIQKTFAEIREQAQRLLTQERAYKQASAELQSQMRIDLDRAIGITENARVGQQITRLQNLLSDRRVQRLMKGKVQDLQSIKKQIRNFIRKNMPEAKYSKSEVNKLLNQVTKATDQNLMQVLYEVEDIIVTKKVQEIKNKIDKELKTPTTLVQSGRRKGKLLIEDQERLDNLNKDIVRVKKQSDLVDAVEKKQAELRARRAELIQKRSQGLTLDEQAKINVEIIDIDTALNYNEASLMENNDAVKLATYESVLQNLNELISEARLGYKAEMQAAVERYNKLKGEFYKDITGKDIDFNDKQSIKDADQQLKRIANRKEKRQKALGKMGVAYKAIGNFMYRHEAIEGMLAKISYMPAEMFEGKASEIILDRLDESARNFRDGQYNAMRVLEEKAKEIWGEKRIFDRRNLRKGNTKTYRKAYQIALEDMAIKDVALTTLNNPEVVGSIIIEEDVAALDKEIKEVEAKIEKYKTTPLTPKAFTQSKEKKAEKRRLSQYLRELKQRREDTQEMFSQAQLYYLYNQYKDKANHPGFESTFGENYEKVMDEVLEKLDPKVKAWADWQVEEFFPSVYNKYNATYRNIYRTNMPWNKQYAGRLRRQVEGERDTMASMIEGSNQYLTAVGGGSTKQRQANKQKIRYDVDGNLNLQTYINEMEFFAAYGENVRDIQKLMATPQIKDAISKTAGADVYSLLSKQLDKVMSYNIEQSDDAIGLIDAFTGAFVTAKLGLNPVVMLKQLTSAVAFADYIGYRNWAKYAAVGLGKGIKNAKDGVVSGKEFTWNEQWKELYKNSGMLQERYERSDISRVLENYVRDYEVEGITGKSYRKGQINDLLMYMVKFGDRGGVMGSIPNYMYYKDEFAKKYPKKTEQEIIDLAVAKVERQISSTQQSNEKRYRDSFQTSQNSALRGLGAFTSSPRALLRKEMYAIRELSKKMGVFARTTAQTGSVVKGYKTARESGKGTWKDNLRTFLTYHYLIPVVFQWVAQGFGFKKDEEELEDLFLWTAVYGNINSLFILGDLTKMIYDTITDKKWAGQTRNLPIFSHAANLSKYAKWWMQGKSDETREKWRTKFLKELFEGLGGAVTGYSLPLNNFMKWFDNITSLGESKDAHEVFLKIFNYNDWTQAKQRGEDPNKKKKKSSGGGSRGSKGSGSRGSKGSGSRGSRGSKR